MKTRILLVALPGGIVSLAAAAALAFADPALLAQAARGFPLAGLVAAALLAWRLHSTRMFSASLLVAAVYMALQSPRFAETPLVYAVCAAFFAPGLTLLAFSRDRGFSFVPLRNHLLLAFAPLLVAAFFSAGNPPAALNGLTRDLIDPDYTKWSGLPQTGLLIVAIAMCVTGVRTLLTRHAIDAALFWLLFATASGLAASPSSPARGIWFLAGAVVLIVSLIETAYSLAFNDELTGLPGRRALNYALNSLEAPYAIAVIDVDHFKNFNDKYGHDVGDQVLRMVAGKLRDVGGGGVAYRSGGEEFTVVFEGRGKEDAAEYMEEVRASIEKAGFVLRRLPRPRGKKAAEKRGRGGKRKEEVKVTISVGIAAASTRYIAPDQVVQAADKAMYKAKSKGRNRVVA